MPKPRDTNALIGAALRDLAAAQPSKRAGFGYKRAANAVLNLDSQIDALIAPDGTLPKIPNVGPKSERVIREVLDTGSSQLVEQAVKASGNEDVIARARTLRKNFLSRAAAVAALRSAKPSRDLPALADYHGDLQMHSTWSDGSQTLDEIIEAGLARGYAFCGVTDHSYGLPIAHGLSMTELAKQHREIDKLNRRYRGRFRLIKGIEANIRADGSVDMSPSELARLELVVAAPHSALRTAADQTARMLGAVRTPRVHILGHPRGRLYGTRPGVSADWPRVFAAAKKTNVAIEIDGDPWRQDVDFDLAALALEAGCLFALDSDAHSPPELRNAETAVAHARRAGIPKSRIINCWETERLLEWLGAHT
jgi:histidinol phosphatase-like PHP family hydrolase